jgi:sulfate transport system ATP-binding protein
MTVSVTDLVRRFGATAALDGVSLDLAEGEFVALLGPSGSGKSTLLRILAGLEGTEAGEVHIAGRDMRGVPARERGIGVVFQNYALFRHMTVFDNVAFGLRVRPRALRPGRGETARRVRELLQLVQIPELERRYPDQVSGGQRQRVALARALAIEPRLLLLDEPFGALDALVRRDVRRWLRSLHDRLGITTILVTHDQEEAMELADRVAVMDRGRIVQEGSAAELASQPGSAFVADFTGAVVLRCIGREGGEGLTQVELEGGATIFAAGLRTGPVAASVYPWEIVLHPPGARLEGSAQNVLAATVTSVTEVADRVRVGLQACQPLVAEVTRASARSLGIATGAPVQASWKATATRLSER